jgi:HAD superfamily hydrolase (TIGR01549 family)
LTVRAVVFDVGETLVDETRAWSAWADYLGIPRLTFLAGLGAVIARGGDHTEVFELFRPDLDIPAVLADPAAGELRDTVRADDLYPDAMPCLAALAAAGFRLGVVGNQPSGAETMFRDGSVPIELVASSATWGVAKPDPAFFARIASELDLTPDQVAYVGDRLDNDVGPAGRAGMVAVFIRRGPWAWIQAGRTDSPDAAIIIESLVELPGALERLR